MAWVTDLVRTQARLAAALREAIQPPDRWELRQEFFPADTLRPVLVVKLSRDDAHYEHWVTPECVEYAVGEAPMIARFLVKKWHAMLRDAATA